MTPEQLSQIATCQACTLADVMKPCKCHCACKFEIGLPKLPPAKMIIGKTFAERWTTNPAHYSEHFKNYHGVIEVQS